MMDGLAELHTHLGGSVSSDILWTLAHEQGIALPVKDYWDFDRLVTVSDPRGVPDLNALDAIYHWTELIQSSPLAGNHDARAALQPDEAKPRWRARPRSHHPRGDPRARSREPRVSAGTSRPDPDDGPHVHAAPERGDRREGDRLGVTRDCRHRHRRPKAGRRAVRLPPGAADGRDRARGGAGSDDPRRRRRR